MKEVFSNDRYDIVLMERDQDGFFVREIEKYTLENADCIESFWLINMDELSICQLRIEWEEELSDDEYEFVLDTYDQKAYESLSGFMAIDEKESYYPTWQISFLYANYEETLKWLEEALSIHIRLISDIKSKMEE